MGACTSTAAVNVENTSEHEELVSEPMADATPQQSAPKEVGSLNIDPKEGEERDRGMLMTEYAFQQTISTTLRIAKPRGDAMPVAKIPVVDLRGLQDRKARVTITPVGNDDAEISVDVYRRGEDLRQFPIRQRDCGGEVIASAQGKGAQSVEFAIPSRGALIYFSGPKGQYTFLAESLEEDFPIYMSHSAAIGVAEAPQ